MTNHREPPETLYLPIDELLAPAPDAYAEPLAWAWAQPEPDGAPPAECFPADGPLDQAIREARAAFKAASHEAAVSKLSPFSDEFKALLAVQNEAWRKLEALLDQKYGQRQSGHGPYDGADARDQAAEIEASQRPNAYAEYGLVCDREVTR